jgi:hypothetical protein
MDGAKGVRPSVLSRAGYTCVRAPARPLRHDPRLRTAMRRHPPRRRQTPPKPTSYAGPTTCLRRDDVFDSWDRRQNRLCPRCREAIEAEPSEEPSHDLPLSIRRPRTRDDV